MVEYCGIIRADKGRKAKMYKHSKEELKHWCDNCCCVDCRQTKKEKLECKRRLKENPKPSSFGRYKLNSPIFVDNELFNQQSIKEHNRLFDKYYSTMKSRICDNNGGEKNEKETNN